jgi:phosphoribosylpyrophosphate synthetase
MGKIAKSNPTSKPADAFPLLSAWRHQLGAPVLHHVHPARSDQNRVAVLRLVADVRTRHAATTVWLTDGRFATAATFREAIDALVARGAGQ